MIWYLFGGVGVLLFMSKGKINEKITEMPAYWNRFDTLFKNIGRKYGVDPNWLKAIALNESDLGRERSVARGLEAPFDVENSKSSDGKSWGLMQVTLTTARDYDPAATEQKLNNPEYSIDLAAQLLKWLKTQFSTTDLRYTEWVIKSYNQGRGNTNKERLKQLPNNPNGFAQEYWERFQRNYKRVIEKGGL